MLKRVHIQNFKSLKDVTLDLQKVNLLIGPNNSGKTNFLKALEYGGITLGQNDSKVKDYDQYVRIKSNFTNAPHIVFISYIFQSQYIDGVRDEVTLTLRPATSLKEEVIKSFIYKSFNEDEGLLSQSEAIFNDPDFQRRYEDFLKYDYLFVRTPEENILNDYRYLSNVLLSEFNIYRPEPTQFVKPSDFSADEIKLLGNCSNLIPFLFYLNTNYNKLYKKIEADISICVKDIISITTPPVKVGKESKLGLKFFGKNDEDFWADEVSEGVLYFLALITIINQPNPPKLLLLEEPERGIHPRRIWEVMKLIFELAEEKDIQIILTTHNEHVVNAFATMPEAVFVFDKDEDTGETTVQNLQKDIIEPTSKNIESLGLDKIDLTENLGENWLYGLIGGVPSDKL